MKKLVLGLALAFVANAAMAADPVKYLDWDLTTSNLVEKTCTAYDLVTADTTALADGKWYVVAGNVVIDNGGNIKVNGSAHLILCDNASLTIKNVADYNAAIDVSASGSTTNSLAIYGQPGGSGVLSATGGRFGAGIGGGYQGAGGIVTINGGSVTANGVIYGAGIGGGDAGAGGTVTVNGGTVTATGGNYGAGIGGGYEDAGGIVTVNGGSLTATGGNYGAGIGGGSDGVGGSVTINGGLVTATGGMNGAGIGGGSDGAGGSVTINGGTVTATGTAGAGIGGGQNGAGGVVTVNGGTVTATGGRNGAGIGGGYKGAGGSVTINGGSLSATGGMNGAGIGGGYQAAGGDHGTVTFGAGAWLVLAGASAPGSEVSAADYANNHSARYVCIKPPLSLKIPAGMHYSYVVSNETTGAVLTGVLVDGTNTYSVKNGSTVKVYFTLDEDNEWDGEFDNPKDLGVIESDKVVDASEMPKTKGLPGSETNPWKVGENVTAYIKDRVLYLKGTGAMDDFASTTEVPWAAVADQVTAVTVEDGVTKIGKNAWAGMADAVTINGSALSVIGFAAPGLASGEPVIPDDKVLVSKEEIAAAKAETVTVVGGAVTLGVTVNTNGDFTAETKTWAPVELKSENVEVKDGKIVISIPVGDKSGFMILQSGDAKVSAERLDSMWGVLVVD